MNSLTVSELNAIVSRTLKAEYILQNFYVLGTVTNLKRHSTGHYYFSLKDEKCNIDAAIWAGTVAKRKLHNVLEDGLLVTVKGNINFYEPSGRINIIVSDVIVSNTSPLQVEYEQLKQELTALGYFAEEHKKAIPELVGCIGIVTSGTGAVLQDILHIAKKRNPLVQFKLFAVPVQGKEAGPVIAKGIELADKDPDVELIIAGRGGGSMEDLWCFNHRSVVEAIYRTKTPIISAVGHETDYTLADFAADARGATPSHATEMAVFPIQELLYRIQQKEDYLHSSIAYTLKEKKQNIFNLFNRRLALPLINVLRQEERRLYNDMSKMEKLVTQRVAMNQHNLTVMAGKLEQFNPLRSLVKGLARVEIDHKPVQSVADVTVDDRLELFLTDGTVTAVVQDIRKDTYGKPNKKL